MLGRHEILARPHWRPFAANSVLLQLPIAELRALDGLVVFVRSNGIENLKEVDCRIWARLNDGLDGLDDATRAMAATEGPEAPQLLALRGAADSLRACRDFNGTSRIPRRQYARDISLAFADLPVRWQERLTDIRARRDDGEISLADDIFKRMIQKLAQYAWYMHDIGFPAELTLAGLQAFHEYETTRISNRGKRLASATILATFSDIQNYMRLSGDYADSLCLEVRKLLQKLGEKVDAEISSKYAALAAIDVRAIRPRAEAVLADAANRPNPAQRCQQRNRAMALAIPLTTPLRREWHELKFGRDIVWDDGRYRLRNYKLRKNRHRRGREEYPGSIHPSAQQFVDAVLLQDDDPKYLDALRERAEQMMWPLFAHPNGSEVAPNYVSQVWSKEFGTGAHIARTIAYDILFALGEKATRGAMLLNDHQSTQAAAKYIGQQARAAALAAAARERDDMFEELMSEVDFRHHSDAAQPHWSPGKDGVVNPETKGSHGLMECPSSDDLGHERLISNGGPGSLVLQFRPLTCGAASGASRRSWP
ncbi:hypothetical protein [Amaricoccus sp. B4]|uniref:hypothetical protein n=1 Tax=Amaricoccus sp. B4 TaxID=3368557 RepID=UPI00371C8EC9